MCVLLQIFLNKNISYLLHSHSPTLCFRTLMYCIELDPQHTCPIFFFFSFFFSLWHSWCGAPILLLYMSNDNKALFHSNLQMRVDESFQYHWLKQLYASTCCLVTSPVYQGLKEDLNCRPQEREKCLRCSGTTKTKAWHELEI